MTNTITPAPATPRVLPNLGLNGTPATRRCDDVEAAVRAVEAAVKALETVAPHGRDYASGAEYGVALAEWRAHTAPLEATALWLGEHLWHAAKVRDQRQR